MSLVLPVLSYSGIWTEGPLLRSISKAATIETECTVFRPTVLYLMCNLCDPAHTELTQLTVFVLPIDPALRYSICSYRSLELM